MAATSANRWLQFQFQSLSSSDPITLTKQFISAFQNWLQLNQALGALEAASAAVGGPTLIGTVNGSLWTLGVDDTDEANPIIKLSVAAANVGQALGSIDLVATPNNTAGLAEVDDTSLSNPILKWVNGAGGTAIGVLVAMPNQTLWTLAADDTDVSNVIIKLVAYS